MHTLPSRIGAQVIQHFRKLAAHTSSLDLSWKGGPLWIKRDIFVLQYMSVKGHLNVI